MWVSDRQGTIPRHNDVTEPTAPAVHKQLGRNNDRICRPGRPPRGLVGCHRARDARTFPPSAAPLVEVAEMVRDALTMCPGVEANPAPATVAFFSQA